MEVKIVSSQTAATAAILSTKYHFKFNLKILGLFSK